MAFFDGVRAMTDRAELEREVAPYRNMTDEQLDAILHSVVRTAARLAADRPDSRAVYAWRDPLPQESVELFKRLREAYRNRPTQ